MERHRFSFFGQKSGILLDSGDFSQMTIFISFVKKKEDGNWERPTNGEGKNIKFNLLEILQILRVLKQKNAEWSTVHKFRQESTPITWKNTGGVIQILIPGYSKLLKFPESQLLYDLLYHIYNEKIQYSTGFNNLNSSNKTNIDTSTISKSNKLSSSHSVLNTKNKNSNDQISKKAANNKNYNEAFNIHPEEWLSHLKNKDDYCLVPGELIAQREKAVAFKISTFNEIWIPRSVILNQQVNEQIDGLWIKHWFLTKKLEDIFNIAA